MSARYHQGRGCHACLLCGKIAPRYTHFRQWTPAMKAFTTAHFGSQITDDDCICRADYMEVKRHRSDPEYVPKWAQHHTPHSECTCSYKTCDNKTDRLIKPSFTDEHQMRETIGLSPEYSDPIYLCPVHYTLLHKTLTMKLNPCKSCGTLPKNRHSFYRRSPNPVATNEYLTDNPIEGISHTITGNDYLCMSCYKLHLALLKQIQENERDKSKSGNLQTNIDYWKKQMNSGDKLMRAELAAVLNVAQEIQQGKAVLLPCVASVFLDAYCGNGEWSHEQPTVLEVEDSKVNFSTKWLLKHLIIHLQPYMEYKCAIRKIGMVLYPRGGDLLICLSLALQQSKNCWAEDTVPLDPTPSPAATIHSASRLINEKVLTEIKKLSENYKEPKDLDIAAFITNCDPLLWDFVCTITESARESAGCKQSESYIHTKKTRRFFILCLLMYTIQPSFRSPIHIAVTDAVQVCGGSRELIKILNRLGVAASADTHESFVTSIAEKEREKKLWDSLRRAIFTLASVDNWDIAKPNASVYCGDQKRGFHGTTLQVVQPNPNLTLSDSTTNPVISQPSGTTLHTTPDYQTANPVPSKPSGTTKNHESGKRTRHTSPMSSPHKLGKVGPKRRRTVLPMSPIAKNVQHTETSHVMQSQQRETSLTLEDFKETEMEAAERDSSLNQVFSYITEKHFSNISTENSMKGMIEFLHPLSPPAIELAKSNIHYMEMINENPDSQETMLHVSDYILAELNSSYQGGWVLLVGDGKTFEHLQAVKKLYEDDMKKLLIFPGDWHTLKNFQPIIMKLYYAAGLKEMAQASGFRGETLTALEKCSNFKRTHNFLKQAWETVYSNMLEAFLESEVPRSDLSIISEKMSQCTSNSPRSNIQKVQAALMKLNLKKKFDKFIAKQSALDNTWKLWSNFVFRDCCVYMSLHTAVRTSNWKLRLSSLKLMAPLFFSFDKTHYQRIIPQHLADLKNYPKEILQCLESGGFTVSLKGRTNHSLALDEAHESCINKDLKGAIKQATDAYLHKTSLFFAYRISCYRNLLDQLFSEKENENAQPKTTDSIFDPSTERAKVNENIDQIALLLKRHNLLPNPVIENRGVLNVFSSTKALPEQEHGLMHCYDIGEQDYENYVTYRILRKPTNLDAPVRQRKLQTMSSKGKNRKKKTSLKEKEEKTQMKCLRKRLAWCSKTGQSFNSSSEQYTVLPRAMCDASGNPHKGAKSNWTDKIHKRYNVTVGMLPQDWKPDAVILDGMFLVNLTPLRQTETIHDYTYLIFRRFIRPYFNQGAIEVHVIFDVPPEPGKFNPKAGEQNRRDENRTPLDSSHTHISFQPNSPLPRPWKNYIQCRQCKRSIVEAIGLTLLRTGSNQLRIGQQIVLAGCFSGEGQKVAMIISGDKRYPQPSELFTSAAVEADERIWRHTCMTVQENVLIYSPDTDVYNIGLGLQLNKRIIVQINVPYKDPRYIDVNHLQQQLSGDTDLSSLPQDKLVKIFQMLFIVTGCDYLSYFSGFGKATFLHIFFQHARFITSGECPGILTSNNLASGFRAFVRLIGTAYFKKHLAGFASSGFSTPDQLYHSFTCTENDDREKQWWDAIRSTCSERILTEEDRPPTHTSLWRHWKRAFWVARMWENSILEDPYSSLPDPEEHGWLKSGGEYSIDWESPEVEEQVSDIISFLTRGCACKQGCTTRRCGCIKKNQLCGPGCECQGCANVREKSTCALSPEVSDQDSEDSDSDDSYSETDSEWEDIQCEIVTDY